MGISALSKREKSGLWKTKYLSESSRNLVKHLELGTSSRVLIEVWGWDLQAVSEKEIYDL